MQDVARTLESPATVFGPHRYSILVIVLLLIPLLVVAGSFASSAINHRAASATIVPRNPAVEARWGIRLTQVASTADAGLVDLRFIVLDPDKAAPIMHDVTAIPVLRPEGTGLVVNSTSQMTSQADLHAGETYFLLYRNTEGSIRRGTLVTVVFADGQTIQHVVAR